MEKLSIFYNFGVKMNRRLRLIPALFAGCLMVSSLSAHADTINWTVWSASTASGATGTLNGVAVTYSGQINGLQVGYPSWDPATTFQSGLVGNAPPAANGAISVVGGTNMVETITFATAITDPTFAIWSLGAGGTPAEFIFDEPITFLGGGPSNEYGGQAIVVSGDTVTGSEGNGIIQIDGTYTTISFTTPVYENYYDFTVGNNATAAAMAATPEPGSLSLLGLGLAAFAGVRRKLAR